MELLGTAPCMTLFRGDIRVRLEDGCERLEALVIDATYILSLSSSFPYCIDGTDQSETTTDSVL